MKFCVNYRLILIDVYKYKSDIIIRVLQWYMSISEYASLATTNINVTVSICFCHDMVYVWTYLLGHFWPITSR